MISIRKSLTAKLSFGLLLLAVLIFIASQGVLFTQSRYMIRAEAVGRANSVLNTTMQRISRNLMTVETATNSITWLVEQSFQPDSLQAFSNRVVRLNPHVDGCSISAEPNSFSEYGRNFSTYTVREDDTITTVIEEPYEYFNKIWYKSPRNLGPCWVAFFDEADSLELTIDGMVASYGRPLFNADNHFIGIISTDLSLLRLSEIMSKEKPYPNSYFMMQNEEGLYIIHPDSTRLFTKTIFSDADPRSQADLFALGHEMIAGHQGYMNAVIDGAPSIVCYQPVPGTSWSLAIVCPDSDILAGYHKLTYIVLPLLIIGLIVIFLLCRRAVSHAVRPLNLLVEKTQSISEGNMEVYIRNTKRQDAIGRLQNSFATMLQSLNFHMGSVRYTSDQSKLRNEELLKATQLVKEADRQKTAFIQNVSHQIRTPLNIIMGFAQILSSSANEELTEKETKEITSSMDHNSKLLNRILLMLYDSSDLGLSQELNTHKNDIVRCNDLAHEVINYIKIHYPDLAIKFQTEVADDFSIQTSHVYLMRSLREILYNSAKYSDGQNVTLRISRTDTAVRFIIEDTGTGIDETDREFLFKFFTKVDDLSEGLGLGLPLSQRHTQNLGGNLTLDTDYHNGCRFILEMPLSTDKKEVKAN